jgi:hypothetical protein
LRAGEHPRCNLGLMGNLNHVRDADIAKAAHLFADANRSAVLLDRRIGQQFA